MTSSKEAQLAYLQKKKDLAKIQSFYNLAALKAFVETREDPIEVRFRVGQWIANAEERAIWEYMTTHYQEQAHETTG